jgi:excisionase family DNA binding protein
MDNNQFLIRFDELEEQIKNLENSVRISAKEHLTLEEAARYLDLSPSYMYKLTCSGTLVPLKPSGKKLYFIKKDLDEWIKSNGRASAD